MTPASRDYHIKRLESIRARASSIDAQDWADFEIRKLRSADCTKENPGIDIDSIHGRRNKIMNKRTRIEEIQDLIAFNQLSPAQVFTQMKQLIIIPGKDELIHHPELMAFSINNVDLKLSIPQYKFLTYLYESSGKPVSRDFINKSITGIEFDGISRSIDGYASKVRKSLSFSKYTIKDIRLIGYMLAKNELDKGVNHG